MNFEKSHFENLSPSMLKKELKRPNLTDKELSEIYGAGNPCVKRKVRKIQQQREKEGGENNAD